MISECLCQSQDCSRANPANRWRLGIQMAARTHKSVGIAATSPDASATPAAIRVAVVEDSLTLRKAVATLLRQTDGFACVGAYGDGEGALAQIPHVKSDVVLLDIGLPGISGIECAALLKAQCPDIRI